MLSEQPQLLRLRELQTLEKMAQSGGRFIIGLGNEGLSDLFKNGEE